MIDLNTSDKSGSVPVIPFLLLLGGTVLVADRIITGRWAWQHYFGFTADYPFIVRRMRDTFDQYNDPAEGIY
jgi:hypothetical protein